MEGANLARVSSDLVAHAGRCSLEVPVMVDLLYIVLWLAGIGSAIVGILAVIGYGSTWHLEIKFVSEEELRRIR